MILGFGYEWLLGGSLTRPEGSSTVGQGVEERAHETTLKQCILELKYLIDSLNDKVAVTNQTLSYFIPALLFLHVVMPLLSGADPTKDNTPISVVTYAATLIVGTFVTLVVVPLRFIAHSRLSKYRKWSKRIEAVLLVEAEEPIKEFS
jgi:hypothetical protein